MEAGTLLVILSFLSPKIEGEVVDLELYIQELPTLSEYTIKGVKKGKIETNCQRH